MRPLVWGSDHSFFPPVHPLLPPEHGQDCDHGGQSMPGENWGLRGVQQGVKVLTVPTALLHRVLPDMAGSWVNQQQ